MPRSKKPSDGVPFTPEEFGPGPGSLGRKGRKKRGAMGPPPTGYEEELLSEEEGLDSLGVPLDAVVKVWCVHSTPNFSLPWQRKRQVRSSGSGFCINMERRAILTNAHCVEWYAQVKVQKRGSDVKHLAKVVSVGWECDCAVLTVEDDEFWKDMKAVDLLGKVPRLEEAVLCAGFPVGGDTISVSSGVISRIEVTTYAQTCSQLLGMQIDAAINDGNSGGPAFNDRGQCLGMAFQSMGADKAENIGYVIPTVVIMHFLTDLLKHGKYTGFPVLGIDIQPMENDILRESFGMSKDQKGVLVNRIAPTSAVANVLKENDVLLSFDGEPIANDGTVRFRTHERVSFLWTVAQKFYGEPAELTVLRDGKAVELKIPNFHVEAPLVPVHLHDLPQAGTPSYLIVAGLVFTALSVPFLRAEFGEEWDAEAPIELVHRVMYQRAESKDEQIVVLSQLLANDLTVGYEDLENTMVQSLNGTKIHNLKHLAKLATNCESAVLRFGLQNNLLLVLKTKDARQATKEVLEQHTIPAAMSADLATAVGPEGNAKDEGSKDEGIEPKPSSKPPVEESEEEEAPKDAKKKPKKKK